MCGINKKVKYVDLHLHTNFSLRDGLCKIEDAVKRTKELGREAIAITDHGNLFGCIEFYSECKKQNIKPVLGCEVYVAATNRFDKRNIEENRYYHLVLLAKNNKGWNNLCKLVSLAYIDGFYKKPRVDFELLKEYHEGIIALSGCLCGEIPQLILRQGYEAAKDATLKYRNVFKKDFYLELQKHNISEDKQVIDSLLKLSKELDIKVVATNDVHYTYKEDAYAQNVMLAIRDNTIDKNADKKVWNSGKYYIKTDEEMLDLFVDIEEALNNSIAIANECNVELEFNNYKPPKFPVPDGITSKEYLRVLCEQGLKDRFDTVTTDIRERFEYEFKVICDMNFADYFLIVHEYVNFARNNGIAVGPGRGSAAGSLITYLLKITDINPLKYGLIFERFLNPCRVTMPDIDVDFGEVEPIFNHLVDLYGQEKVCKIIAFSGLKARGAIRDVCKFLSIDNDVKNNILNCVPEKDIKITDLLNENSDFKSLYNNNIEAKRVIDIAIKLEGSPRQISTHASGILIAESNLSDTLGLFKKDNTILTHFSGEDCEKLGFLKVDVLRLSCLSIIKDTKNMLKQSIDLKDIDLNDSKVYDYISTEHTFGIFQLESKGMTSFMRDLKPRSIEEIAVGISLYRPGPEKFIPQYIKAKKDKNSIIYRHPLLEPILKDTYGCIVHQEQVMQIVRELAGYTLAEADNFRRIVAKKKVEKIEVEKEKFLQGCSLNNIEISIAKQIFDDIKDFAKYAFNKSHAVSYAILAYTTAYLKYYYTTEYMAVLIESYRHNLDKLKKCVEECRNTNIKVLTVDINKSELNFSVSGDNEIIFGFSGIAGFDITFAEAIVKERNKNGKFLSLSDFVARLRDFVTDAKLKNLILVGAFDNLGGTRMQHIAIYKKLCRKISKSLPTDFTDELGTCKEFNSELLLDFEKKLLGVPLSDDLVDSNFSNEYVGDKSLLKVTSDFVSSGVIDGEAIKDKVFTVKNNEWVVVAGRIKDTLIKRDKKNRRMALFYLEDGYGQIRVTVFADKFDKFRDYIKDNTRVIVSGYAKITEVYGNSILLDSLKVIHKKTVEEKACLFIKVKTINNIKEDLFKVFAKNEGCTKVLIYGDEVKQTMYVNENYNVKISRGLIEELSEFIDYENIVVVRNRFK